MKITAILTMERLEDSVQFWTTRIGFEMTVSVPHGESLGFAILQRGNAELMLQSYDSAQGDIPAIDAYCRACKSLLFIEVQNFDDILRRVEGAPVAVPVRTTPYGMKEIGIYEPGGHLVIFACPVAG